MRILKVTQAYHPFLDRGGPAIKVRSVARGLVKLGHQVTVLTADLGFANREIETAGVLPDALGWRSALDDVETIYLRTGGHYRNLTVNPGVVSFCRRSLKEFDLVHIYGLYDMLGPVVARYCRGLRTPYLIEPLGMTRPIDRGFFLKKLWKRLTGKYMAEADAIITTSTRERDELLAEGFPPGQVLLRYNGIELDEFRNLPAPGSFRMKLGLKPGDRIVLFLGRLIPRKGADLLIEALAMLNSPTVKLVIAGPEGEAGYIATLGDMARLMGVEQQVIFVGPMYGEDKKAAFGDADIFALPSRYENFGNSAAEAMACGTPVIVSDQCGIAPLVEGRAGAVTAYSSRAVADGLRQLLNNERLYSQFKEGCPQVAQELSWTKLIMEMEDAYAQLTQSLPTHATCLSA